MKGKTLLYLALVTSMLLSVLMIGPVGAQSTTIGVEPDSIVDPGLVPGLTFTVEIWIRDVEDLAGIEFTLGYDPTVLNATLIEYGGIYLPNNYLEWINEINEAEGWLHYSISRFFNEPSFYGDGRAAIINFTVLSQGASALDLYEIKLGDSTPPPMGPLPIDHEALDGYFNNVPPPSVTLARHSAWPEHHHYSTGKDEDSSNDLFAIVKNDGTENTYVKVVFTVTKDGTGIPQGDFETPTMQLLVGAMYGHKSADRYKAEFTPSTEGKYYVSAQCWADTNLDTVPDTPMGKIKSFSFSVVP